MKIRRLFPTIGTLCFFLTAFSVPALGDPGEGQRVFFGFSRTMPDESPAMQQRGYDAVQQVSARLESAGFETHLLQSPLPNNAGSPQPVTRKSVLKQLDALCETLDPNDTLIIYSHTHGLKTLNGRTGGLLLGRARPSERGILSWPDYAEKLLRLPVKNVVVLTMACHSGGLTDWLKSSEEAQRLLKERREKGRNFLVLTSQKAGALSNPRPIEGRIINPFTYAVIKAFEGAADGYRSGKPAEQPDGALTLAELSAFIPDETAKHKRTADPDNDPDPQTAGAFDPDAVILSPGLRRIALKTGAERIAEQDSTVPPPVGIR
jgi:uncharacterized caspase-like protein